MRTAQLNGPHKPHYLVLCIPSASTLPYPPVPSRTLAVQCLANRFFASFLPFKFPLATISLSTIYICVSPTFFAGNYCTLHGLVRKLRKHPPDPQAQAYAQAQARAATTGMGARYQCLDLPPDIQTVASPDSPTVRVCLGPHNLSFSFQW
jgi:hypothetical protein